MINTILFDYDGTLMDTNEVVLQSWQHTFRTIRGYEEDPEVIRQTFGEPLVMTLAKLFPETPVDKSLDIYRTFQREVFTDKHKPDPAPILITLDRMGSLPEEAIMVGDTMFDLLCAQNAGVKSVIVDWSVTMTADEKKQADYVIKSAEDLLNILI